MLVFFQKSLLFFILLCGGCLSGFCAAGFLDMALSYLCVPKKQLAPPPDEWSTYVQKNDEYSAPDLSAACEGRVYASLNDFEADWLPSEHCQVRVVLLSGDQKYSAMLNMADYRHFHYYKFDCRWYQLKQPWPGVLRDEFLRAYVLQDGHAPARIRSLDFGVQDAILCHYEQRRFESNALDSFVRRKCPEILLRYMDDVVFNSPDWKPLNCRYPLDGFLSDQESIFWSLATEESFMQDVAQAKVSNPKVFVLVRGSGILQGSAESEWFFSPLLKSRPPKTLFDEKMLALRGSILDNYAVKVG